MPALSADAFLDAPDSDLQRLSADDFLDAPTAAAEPKTGTTGDATPGKAVTPMEAALSQLWEVAQTPLTNVTGADVKVGAHIAGRIVAPTLTAEVEAVAPEAVTGGLADSYAKTINGLNTPSNIALLGALGAAPYIGLPAFVGRAASLGFSAQAAHGMYENIRGLHGEEDPKKIVEGVTDAVTNGAFATAAGIHAVKGGGNAPTARDTKEAPPVQSSTRLGPVPLETKLPLPTADEFLDAPEADVTTATAETTSPAPGSPIPATTGTVLEPGTIPIEGLPPEEAAPAVAQPEAPAAPSAAAVPTFLADPAIPFLAKERIQEQLRTLGVSDEELATLTTPQVQERIAQAPTPPPAEAPEPTNPDIEYYQNRRTASQAKLATEQEATKRRQPTAEEKAAAQAEADYHAELLRAANEEQGRTSDEFLDAIVKFGGFPDKTSPHYASLKGELDGLIESVRAARSEAPKGQRKIFTRVFSPEAGRLDRLTEAMQEAGFPIETADDLIEMTKERLSTGRPIYGNPAMTASRDFDQERVFASGSSTPRQRGNASTLKEVIAAGQTPRPGAQRRLQYLKTTPEQAARIKAEANVETTGSYHVIDDDFVRKTLRDHGNPVTEARRGNSAVTPADMERIPEIVRNFDTVEKVVRDGQAGLRYSKRFNGTTYFVETGPNKNQRLLAKTMWKRPSPPQQSPLSVAPPQSSETLRSTTPSENQPNQPGGESQGQTFASGTASPQPKRTPAPAPAPSPRAPRPPSSPAVANAAAPVKQWWIQRTIALRKIVAPQTIDHAARQVGNIIRSYNGKLANTIIQADHALTKARADFDKTPVPRGWRYDPAQPLPRNYAFMAESERGMAGLSPADRALKSQLDNLFGEAVAEVHRVNPKALKSLIQDYFPHVWKDPAQARQVFASLSANRPLEGPRSFLKQRSLAYIEDGLKAGLVPVSDNPIDVVLTKLHEVHKFVAAQDMLREAKEIGARKFVYIFEKPPEGWLKVEDRTSTVHGPPFVKVAEAFDEQMKVKTVELLNKLGVPHERLVSLGGTRWGLAANAGMPPGRIKTKFAGPISVYWHELGHVLQFRYNWLETILGENYDKKTGKLIGPVKHGSNHPRAIELRNLADLRAEGSTPSKSFKKYLRNADEKAAVMLEAYMHAPARMQEVAPVIYGRVKKFIAAHPELAPINDIRPSLVLGSAKDVVPVGGMVTLGHYYMPEGAAAVFNNYLSPGLMRFGPIRALRQSTNILSGIQLGFSAFHAGFTSIDAAVSQFALGLRYASEGKLAKAAEKIITTPAAPITNYLTGREIQRAMIDPSKATPEAAQIAQLAVQAGLRATVDPFWKTEITRNMLRAFRQGGARGYAGTILRLPFAASEQMMRPILEFLVVRQKLGVFAGMAQQHMERLGPNADIHQVRDAMARVADATEDRMGQMTYDNLFYHRVVRDAALLGFRAYGWTFGKYRALFGGIGDTLGTVGRLKEGGPVLTDRMAYLLALPIVASAIGSTMNYMMTGQAPQDWRDMLMPRTGKLDRNGNPQRLSLPTYIKDILSDWHDFPDTKKMLVSLGHKLNPWISIASDVINNADFYNTQVFDPDDPILKQQADKVAFVAKSAQPFALSSTIKLREGQPTYMEQALPFFGFVPAKAALSMTPAQTRAAELFQATLPKGARTQDKAEHADLLRQLTREMQAADPSWQDHVSAAIASRELTPQEFQKFPPFPLSPLQFQVKRLPALEAMKVWDLANAEERQILRPLILQKIGNSKTITPEQRSWFFQVLSK